MADDRDFQLQNSLQAIEFGKECVRAGIIINGGAAVALIGLLGGDKSVTDADGIRASLTTFCVGVIAAFVAAMIGYFAQTAFAIHNLKNANGRDSSDRRAVAITGLGIIAILVSIGAFCYGIYRAGLALFPERCSDGSWYCFMLSLLNHHS